jgi:nitrate/nitrite transport system substrate-binding protein
MITRAPDYESITRKVMRSDIYEEAMKEIGYAHIGLNNEPETFFDGKVFDPANDLEAYAKSFPVNNIKG